MRILPDQRPKAGFCQIVGKVLDSTVVSMKSKSRVGSHSCCSSFLRSCVETKVSSLTVTLSVGEPTSRWFVKTHTIKTTGIIWAHPLISQIIRFADSAQVFQPVIAPIPVDVINCLWLRSMYQLPDYTVSEKTISLNRSVKIAASWDAKSWFSSVSSIPPVSHLRPKLPNKRSGFWIIVKHAFQRFYIMDSCHAGVFQH